MKRIVPLLLLLCVSFTITSQVEAVSLVTGNPADYVIITVSGWEPALNYYVAQKTAAGYSPRVFVIEDIYANYPGAAECEQILNFIKDAFNVWGISYVLLVGDLNYVPSGPAVQNAVERDMYYVLFDGPTDKYRDAYIGRLPVKSYDQVLAISTRWADYDTSGWGRSEFCLTGIDVGESANNDFGQYGWQAVEMHGDDLFVAIQPDDIINEMNVGHGLVNWVGHGATLHWAVKYGPWGSFSYDYGDANQMTNANRLSFVNALYSCNTGKFRYDTNIAKNFIKAPLGGAIGYIGANKLVYTNEARIKLERFYREVKSQYLRTGYVMPGVAFHDSVWDKIYNLLGDPTARMNLLPAFVDTLPPEVSDIQLSQNNILPGQETYLSAIITDNDAVGIVSAEITLPDLTLLQRDMTESAGRYEVRLIFDDTAQAGSYNIEIAARDISQNNTVVPGPVLTVIADNQAPQITDVTITPQPSYQSQPIDIDIAVTDNAGAWQLDKWVEITKPNAEVIIVDRWNLDYFQGADQAGAYDLLAYARDYSGNPAVPYAASFSVLADAEFPVISDYWVSDRIRPPFDILKIASVDTPGARIVLYETATDNVAQNDQLVAWAEITKPDSTVVSANLLWQGGSFPTAYFAQTSETGQIGAYSIVYYAQDQTGNTTQSAPLAFQVTGNNLPPQIILPDWIVNNGNIADVDAGALLNFVVSAVDPDGDPVTLSAYTISLPSGWSFDAVTGEFSWTPASTEVGTYTVTFGATDGHPDNVGLLETVTIVVSPPIVPFYGDVSENGTISATDASLAARYAVGLIALTPAQITKADVTGNGSVSATDAAWIARKAVDPTIVFPVEP